MSRHELRFRWNTISCEESLMVVKHRPDATHAFDTTYNNRTERSVSEDQPPDAGQKSATNDPSDTKKATAGRPTAAFSGGAQVA